LSCDFEFCLLTFNFMRITFKHEIKQQEKLTSKQITGLILKNRKIKDVKEFLNPKPPVKINLSDFGFEKEIKKTFSILKKIKKSDQTIVVYTDYDADGITGGAILWETLHLSRFKVMPYVPHRRHEGYGFSQKGIDNVKKLYDPALIISVDHGITKVQEISYAKKLGIKIIVTDHHLKQEKIPKADAVFHISALSGSGVSYFFSKMIFNHFSKDLESSIQHLASNFQSDYLALASIGTIADLVPLIGPSRSLVKYGLEAFSKVKRPGIRHILKEAGIENKKITPYEVGFMIAPRINAVGRLEHAIDALRLLCTTNESRAYELAKHLGLKNRERQDLVKQSIDQALEIVNNSKLVINPLTEKLIVLTSNKWHEGIIGLIASKISEKYYRPTFILTKVDGVYKGSARSVSGFDITNFLRSIKKGLLIDVGGHKQAAGFTIDEKKLKEFIKAVEKKAKKEIDEKLLEKKIEVDLKIPLSQVSLNLALEIEKLAPFGIGNPQPTFLSEAEINGAQLFGKNQEHLKLFANNMEFIYFFQGSQFLSLSRGKKIEIVYRLDINRWRDIQKLRGVINFLGQNI